jgi:predicted restriction endonuclease
MSRKPGFKHSEETRRRIGLARVGKPLSKEHREAFHRKLKGRNLSMETRLKISRATSGSNNPNWRGGIEPERRRIRQKMEYKLWRKAVFERDNYTCVWCGAKCRSGSPVVLNADHIKPFALYPELRFAIDNGRTLCVPCHRTTDTYGGRSNKSYSIQR